MAEGRLGWGQGRERGGREEDGLKGGGAKGRLGWQWGGWDGGRAGERGGGAE